MKKIVGIVLIVCLLMAVATACAAPKTPEKTYEQEYKLHDGKPAIVILPGLLASGLYDKETGEALWDPVKSDDVDLLEFMGVYDETHVNITVDSLLGEWLDLFDYAGDVLADNDRSIMRRIMCDEEGNADPNVVGVPVGYEGHIRYGALNSYKWWAEGLEAEFGDEYEVVVFNYNWLTDTRIAARDLAAFMEQNNYTDTILIGHSMGGIVASEYLAMDAKSRARIDKFIAVAVPFYGSYMASSTFETPYVFRDLIDYYLDEDAIKSSELFKQNEILQLLDISAFKKPIYKLYDEMIIPFLYNMKSVYQLLPSAELLALQTDLEGEGATENGQKVSPDALYDWYLTRPFTTVNPLATKAEAATLSTRKIFDDWQTYRDGFYVDRPEGKVFSCDLVDTYYIAGVGSTTELGVKVEGETRTTTVGKAGDGTVPQLSATRGKAEDGSHVFLVEGETHIPMGTHWAGGQKDATISIIKGKRE